MVQIYNLFFSYTTIFSVFIITYFIINLFSDIYILKKNLIPQKLIQFVIKNTKLRVYF